ncbi:MAG: hypothetical protein COB37_08160 [Kordiimonadales bacterium]|nr:MAG: hypothetical protein COB37_08160 [Kordiimonadales bacterium]
MNEINRQWPGPRSVACLLGWLSLITFCASTVSATNAPLRLATREYLPPYINADATAGIEIDIVKAIFNQAKIEIKFVQMPDLRMTQAFSLKTVDGILTQNVKVKSMGCATDWYFTHPNVAITLAQNEFSLHRLEDLSKYSVVTFDGAQVTLGKRFADAVKNNPRYVEFENQPGHIELLYKGRFEVIFGDEWILRLARKNYFKKSGQLRNIRTHQIAATEYFSVRFHDQKHCDSFNQALKLIRNSGLHAAILAANRRRIDTIVKN